LSNITADIDLFKGKLISALQQAMVQGMRQFEAYEIKNEMSGRPGLKRKSGSLAGGWSLSQEGEGLDFKVKLNNSASTWYAIVHQTGKTIVPKNGPYLHFKLDDGSYRKVKEVTIPKRLNIPENFETKGKEYIMAQLKKAASGLHKA
jgi:hypothetical protein